MEIVNCKLKIGSVIKKIFIFLLSAVAIFSIISFWPKNNDKEKAVELTKISSSGNKDSKGQVLGEEGISATTNFFKSDNFVSPQVSFGGDAVVYPSGSEQIALEISEVKSELLTGKDKNVKQLLVNWKTNKPALSAVEYMRTGSPSPKKIEEDNYGFDHSALLPNLESSSTYNFTIITKDKWSNEQASDKYAFYSGAPDISFLDLIMGAFKDVFGWAVKK